MESNQIEEIVRKVYEKAKKNCASEKKFALSTHVSEHIDLSYKTIQRAFDRYINGLNAEVEPTQVTIDFLCSYLGYENYGAYIRENPVEKRKGRQWKIIIGISVALCAILFGIFLHSKLTKRDISFFTAGCMIWVKTHYEKIDCEKKVGLEIEPLDLVKLKNFKKVEVSLTTDFFDEHTDKPLIWYHKTKEGTIEYYTAPGLHPINRKTLDEITPYIIEKYVPKHTYKEESFVNE